MSNFVEKAKAVVIGHAVADALGVPVEFADRTELEENPVTDMEGFGTYQVPKGAWSDDTSMSLCVLDVIAEKKEIDWDKIMDNFQDWLMEDKFTPTGKTFDAGRTCVSAISNYFRYGTKATESGLTDEMSNGNGSLMRIHPFVLYGIFQELPFSDRVKLIENASSLTHAHNRSKVACLIYMFVLEQVLVDAHKDSIILALRKARAYLENYPEALCYKRIFKPDFKDISCEDIKSSGYVVDTLEAAIWCVLNSESYKECVLKAVNLGGDTDTIAAIAGGLAGVLYGYDAIPEEWRNVLIKKEYIEGLCEKAFE